MNGKTHLGVYLLLLLCACWLLLVLIPLLLLLLASAGGFVLLLLLAAAAEVGHNMGLGHDGTSTVGYYEGQGDWAPVSDQRPCLCHH
jgi:hypothetical protein